MHTSTYTAKAPNLQLLKKSHQNKWVAFSHDYKRIVGVSQTLPTLKKKTMGKDVVVMRVLPFGVGYAPHGRV